MLAWNVDGGAIPRFILMRMAPFAMGGVPMPDLEPFPTILDPESPHLPTPPLQGGSPDLLSSIHLEWIERAMVDAHVPGLALALATRAGIIYSRGFGVTSMEEGMPVTPSTLFRVASVTKPMTGTMIMRLVDRGLIDIDRPVTDYLPWFKVSDADATERMTPRMLLVHTSGIPHDHKPFGPRGPEALEARVRNEIPAYPLLARPGQKWAYSNAGTHIVAHIAEVVAGKYYADLMQELIFDPLGMTRTTFDPTVAMTYPLAQSHVRDDDGLIRVEHRQPINSANNASGQAYSTVEDVARFATLHLGSGMFGGERLISSELINAMHAPQAVVDDRRSYGLTFFITDHGSQRWIGHSGGIAGYRTRFEMNAKAGTAVIIAMNRLTDDFPANSLIDSVFSSRRLLDQALTQSNVGFT